ncbi:MAG: histidine kinase dimerization/phospho-acceptor domain-containing protein, partial [Acidobacteriota bacterium]
MSALLFAGLGAAVSAEPGGPELGAPFLGEQLLGEMSLRELPQADLIESLEEARRSQATAEQIALLSELSRRAWEAGREEEAYESLRQAHRLEARRAEQQSTLSLRDRQATSRAKSRQVELDLLQEEGALRRAMIRRETWTRRGLALASALAVAILGLLFNRYRMKEREARVRGVVEKEREVNTHLREIDRLKDDFLTTTSQELRTPLLGIVELAQSLLHSAPDLKAPLRPSLTAMVQEGRRLGALMDDIAAFSKLDKKHFELSRQPVQLRALTDVVLTLLKPLAPPEVRLVNSVDADLPAVTADSDRIRQVLHNLIGNALEFTPKGVVEVSAERIGEELEVRVSDTGLHKRGIGCTIFEQASKVREIGVGINTLPHAI